MAVMNDHVLPGSTSVFPRVKHIEWPVDALGRQNSGGTRQSNGKSLTLSRGADWPCAGRCQVAGLSCFLTNSLSQQFTNLVNI